MNSNTATCALPLISLPADILSAWAGIDVGQKNFDAAVWTPYLNFVNTNPASLPHKQFPRTAEGVSLFCSWAEHIVRSSIPIGASPPPLRVVMDATGHYSIELAQFIIDARPMMRPAIINPHSARNFAKSINPQNKSDIADCRAYAIFGASRQPAPYHMMTQDELDLRSLTRQRQAFVEIRSAEKLRLNSPLLNDWISKLIARHIRELDNLIDKIEARIKKTIANIANIQRDVAILDSIFGVGFITAAGILAELGDLRRFKKGKQLAAFAGLSPRVFQSGTSVHKKRRISKMGNSHSRFYLYMASLSLIRGDNDLADFYNNLTARAKEKKSALAAVMRKLLLLMRAILISGQPYQRHYKKTQNENPHHIDSYGNNIS